MSMAFPRQDTRICSLRSQHMQWSQHSAIVRQIVVGQVALPTVCREVWSACLCRFQNP